MLTSNVDFLDQVRQGLYIWNIFGSAEEFLRQAPRYRHKFKQSCIKVMDGRDRFSQELKTIPEMIVYPPDANYIFCKSILLQYLQKETIIGSEGVHNLGYLHVLIPVALGAGVMLLIALIVNNIPENRR